MKTISGVRFRGVRLGRVHMVALQVVVGHSGVLGGRRWAPRLFACPNYPALQPPALPRQPHHHCTVKEKLCPVLWLGWGVFYGKVGCKAGVFGWPTLAQGTLHLFMHTLSGLGVNVL